MRSVAILAALCVGLGGVVAQQCADNGQAIYNLNIRACESAHDSCVASVQRTYDAAMHACPPRQVCAPYVGCHSNPGYSRCHNPAKSTRDHAISACDHTRDVCRQNTVRPPPCPVDCVGDWGELSRCDVQEHCGNGHKIRTYTVTTSALYGGQPCRVHDGATETQTCTEYSGCEECRAGQHHPGGDLTLACENCTAGKYMDSRNSLDDCHTCPAGQFSSEGAHSCIDCEHGKYSLANAASCITCAAATPYGRSRDNIMYSRDEAALYGTYSPVPRTRCDSCDAGQYRAEGQSDCERCDECEEPHPSANCDGVAPGDSRGCPTTALPTPTWIKHPRHNSDQTPATQFPTKLEVCIAVDFVNNTITNLEERMDRWIATARDYLLQGAAANAAVIASQLCAEEAYNDLPCLASIPDKSTLIEQQRLACDLASTAAREAIVRDPLRPNEVRGTLTFNQYSEHIRGLLNQVQSLNIEDQVAEKATQIMDTIEEDDAARAQDEAAYFSFQRDQSKAQADEYALSIRSMEQQIQQARRALQLNEEELMESLRHRLHAAQTQFDNDKDTANQEGQKAMIMGAIKLSGTVGLVSVTAPAGQSAAASSTNPAGFAMATTGAATAVATNPNVQAAALDFTGSVMDFFHCRQEVEQLCAPQHVGHDAMSFEVEPCEDAIEVSGSFVGSGASSLSDHVSCDVPGDCCSDNAMIRDTGCMEAAACEADKQAIREALAQLKDARDFIASLDGLTQLSDMILDPNAEVDVQSLPHLALQRAFLDTIDANTTVQIFRNALGADQLESLVPSVETLITLLRAKLDTLANYYKDRLEAQSFQVRQQMLVNQAQRYRQSIDQRAEDRSQAHLYVDGVVREKCYVALQYLIQQTQAWEFTALVTYEPLDTLMTTLLQERLEPAAYGRLLTDYSTNLDSARIEFLSQSNNCGDSCYSVVDIELSQVPGNTFRDDGQLTVAIEMPENVGYSRVTFSDVAVYLLGLPDEPLRSPIIEFKKKGTSSFLDETGKLWQFTHLSTQPAFRSAYYPSTCERTHQRNPGSGVSLCDLNSVYMRYSPYGLWDIAVSGIPPGDLQAIHAVRFAFHLSKSTLSPSPEHPATLRSDRVTFFDAGQSEGTGVCQRANLDAGTIGPGTGEAICQPHIDYGDAAPPPPPLSTPPAPPNCQQMLVDQIETMNSVCCADLADCPDGPPTTCSATCADVLGPYFEICSGWVSSDTEFGPILQPLVGACEDTKFGAYNAGSIFSQRCSSAEKRHFLSTTLPATCCGAYNENCPDTTSFPPLPTTCTPQCAPSYEDFYSECHVSFDGTADAPAFDAFLALCQAQPHPGH